MPPSRWTSSCEGTRISMMRSVIAIAITASANASSRNVSEEADDMTVTLAFPDRCRDTGSFLPTTVCDIGQAPVLATTFRTPGNAQRASIRGTRAYVADGPAGLQVLDFSNPSQPTIVGSYKTAMPARDVAVTDSLVFVVVGGEEVMVLRQTP